MKLVRSAILPALALLLSAVSEPVSGGAVSFVTIRKNDGAHGHSSTSYGIQHGDPAGPGTAHVQVLQGNTLGPAPGPLRRGSGPPPVPAHPQPAQLSGFAGGPLGPNGVSGGPVGLVGPSVGGPLAGPGGFGGPGGPRGPRGPGGPGGLNGPSGPIGARLVQPGPLNGPLDGPLDGPLNGPLDGPIGGPAGLPNHSLIRLRDDPANRVGVNGRAPVKDSLPRPALRTITGTPVWVPSFTNDPPSYEK
ncbi:collagen alpha-1(III) chain-like [Amphibalanus amphitrite]|uniref:collagen alpha-1(III) chain-like n=1 Tax=Amphibalanus amphitrite TaxID=1232801 RepID=UPI001C919161|nr:collagen alpha-1(III) chain-like [Amphibalanus amphitrite]